MPSGNLKRKFDGKWHSHLQFNAWYNSNMNATTILDRFLDPVTQILPEDTARQILELRITPELQARLDELAEKGNQGTLTSDEREEYAEYIEGLDLISVFKLKTRAALRRDAP